MIRSLYFCKAYTFSHFFIFFYLSVTSSGSKTQQAKKNQCQTSAKFISRFLHWLVQSDHQRHKSATTSSISFFGSQYRLLLFCLNLSWEYLPSTHSLFHQHPSSHVQSYTHSYLAVAQCNHSLLLFVQWAAPSEFRKLLKGISMVLVKKERIRSHSLPRAGFFLANPRPISIFTSAFLFKVKTGTYWN